MEPQCVGHCPNDDEECTPIRGEIEDYALPLEKGGTEVGWKQEFHCACKKKK